MLNRTNRWSRRFLRLGLAYIQTTGIAAFTLDKRSITVVPSKLLRVYSFLPGALFAAALIPTLRNAIFQMRTLYSSVIIIFNTASLVVQMPLSVSAMCNHSMSQNRIISTINQNITLLKAFIDRTGGNVFDNHFLLFLFLKGLLTGIQGAIEMYGGLRMFFNGNYAECFRWLFYCYSLQSFVAILNTYYTLMLFVEQSFKLCSSETTMVVKILNKSSDNCLNGVNYQSIRNSSDELDSLMTLWNTAHKACQQTQNAFEFQKSSLLVGIYCNAIMKLFRAFAIADGSDQKYPHLDVGQELVFVTCGILGIFLFIYVAGSTADASKEMRKSLEYALSAPIIGKRITQNIETHYLQSILKEFQITVTGMFVLDKSLIIALCMATILYLTLVVEFCKT